MEKYILAMVCLILYVYYLFQIVAISKGKVKNVIGVSLTMVFALGGELAGYPYIGYTVTTLVLALFVVFYGEEPIVGNWIRVVLPGVLLTLFGVREGQSTQTEFYAIALGIFVMMLFFLLSYKRGYLNIRNGVLVALLVIGILLLNINVYYKSALILVLFYLLESTLREYQMGYESNARDLQNRLLQQQYEEIRSVYLNLRGWRHDYHNHIQVMKAFIDSGQIKESRDYLNEIETELERVDSFVRSGNLMADAILNSKITHAANKGILVTFDATLSEELFISDMDLCVILGNILDNAIESCEKIPEKKRFMRIYIAIVKEQLYISVQNAAPEILNFEERNYISTKRGNHGLGMKRVAAVVEKRGGFLNLNNEAGIFGTEIMIPKP